MRAHHEFWTSWKNRTVLEEAAIRSLRSARDAITSTIPSEELIAIYAKGSLVRREMTERSDVDTLTIVRHSRWLGALSKLRETELQPRADFSGYSLWELERNTRSKRGKPDRASPARMLAQLPHFELIYGTPLDPNAFTHDRDSRALLASMVHAFRTEFLPRYEQDRFAFSDLVKQTFWLAENDLRSRGVEAPHHWGRLTALFPNEHIIHDALRLRKHPSKDPSVRSVYTEKLERYLDDLERQLNDQL